MMSQCLDKTVVRIALLGMLLLVSGCAREPEKVLTPADVMNQPDARLRSIILTKIEMVNMTIEDVVHYLSEQSRLADPDKTGVTILYKSFNLNHLPPRVNLRLPQATVAQALDEACRQARCNYLVQKDVITVLPESMFKSPGAPRSF